MAFTYFFRDLLTGESIGQSFSMIVCKNVLLHFQPAERVEVIRMFHRSLAPGGYFATEQTQKMPAETAGLFEQVPPEARGNVEKRADKMEEGKCSKI